MEAALREAESKLVKLQSALSRLDEPGIGHGSRCRQPISFTTLKDMRDTQLCMNSAKKRYLHAKNEKH